MPIADPSLVKQAISEGATYSGGLLTVSGVDKYLQLDVSDPAAPFWKLDAGSGVPIFNRAHFNRIANNSIITDAQSPYRFCFENGGAVVGQLALVTVDGEQKAMIIDPP